MKANELLQTLKIYELKKSRTVQPDFFYGLTDHDFTRKVVGLTLNGFYSS